MLFVPAPTDVAGTPINLARISCLAPRLLLLMWEGQEPWGVTLPHVVLEGWNFWYGVYSFGSEEKGF